MSKDKLLQTYKDCHLALPGDCRCDSPGSSAKFCTYSLMDLGVYSGSSAVSSHLFSMATDRAKISRAMVSKASRSVI